MASGNLPNRWITCHSRLRGARLRLFCFPYAGGGASIYRGWSAAADGDIEVCPVQLPGRETRFREPAFDRMELLIDALLETIWDHLDRPFAFFGHSMGALVAYELTRCLRRHGGRLPSHLFVSAHRAPHLPDRDPAVSHLPDAELLEKVREMGGSDDEALCDADLMEILLPMLRADFALCERYRYRPEPPLPCRLSAFAGSDDATVPLDEARPWERHTTGPFTLRVQAGDHFYVHSARDELIGHIMADLSRVRQRTA
jgi:medium-chain acyl-[acyl-carrier-protein] hydrolase